MRIETVATGDELRLGEIVDTNSAHISRALRDEGFELSRMTVVGDDRGHIESAITSASERSDVVIVTGGLGPTEDDLTRQGLADAMGVDLEEHTEAIEAITSRTGRALSEAGRRQILAPVGATLIENPHGTAPGIRADIAGATVYVMPGVPFEMKRMFDERVLPDILSRSSLGGASARHHLVVHGVPESVLAGKLSGVVEECEQGCDLLVGTRVRYGTIVVRILARAATATEAEDCVSRTSDAVRQRLGESIFGEGDHDLAWFVTSAATERNLKIAVAESCTGGMVTARLVAVPGVSAVLQEAVVAYSNEAKERRLGVDPDLLRDYGAVSEQVARAMVEGLRERSGADIAVATTGIAGPSGGTDEKPVGLVYLASASNRGTHVVEKRFRGDRNGVRERSTEVALWLLLREAIGDNTDW